MALTPAEKQHRYRERQSALAQANPETAAQVLLEKAAQCEQLSAEQRAELADRLADLAMHLLRRAQHLAAIAQKVRPPGWNPFPDLERRRLNLND
jgi:predicted flavoprotein YhiN